MSGTRRVISTRRRSSAMLALLLLLLLLSTASARAHLPELFGREYVPAPAGEPPQAAAPAPRRDDDLARLEALLRRFERRDGPYGAALGDPLVQLAALQRRRGNPVAALRSYERALHVLRVNNGLLHRAQLPLLRALAEVYVDIGDLRSSQLTWRYALRVHGLGEVALYGEALEDALAYFQAVRDAYIHPAAAPDTGLLLDAFDDNQRLLEAQLDDPRDDPAALEAVVRSQLRNLYVLLGSDPSGGQLEGDPRAELLLRHQVLGLGRGLDLLDLLLERLAPEPGPERARLLLERGNWKQWNGRWRSARRDYAAAFAASGDDARSLALRERLARPAELPEDPQLWRSLQQPGIGRRAQLRASYRVSARGEASRIRATVEGDGSSAWAGRLRRMLADSHFRPALEAGEPVDADSGVRRYLLLD